jgi:hypothetical protein
MKKRPYGSIEVSPIDRPSWTKTVILQVENVYRPERGSMQNNPITLLLVDDDEQIRKILSIVLAQVGYSVRTASNGFAALSELRKDPRHHPFRSQYAADVRL